MVIETSLEKDSFDKRDILITNQYPCAQLLKVRNRMGICLRGPKLHAKFMVTVWGIKICALKAPVQWH